MSGARFARETDRRGAARFACETVPQGGGFPPPPPAALAFFADTGSFGRDPWSRAPDPA